MKIENIISLAQSSGYNEGVKMKFKSEAMRYLKQLAKALNLNPDSFSIRFNPGGIAVSGDATLHHEKIYLTVGEMGAFWRTCKGLRDYTGGQNHWIVGFGQAIPHNELIQRMQKEIA